MRANALVPDGGDVHSSGGDRSAPSQVCCWGMVAPSLKAGLESWNAMAVPPSAPSPTSIRTTTTVPPSHLMQRTLENSGAGGNPARAGRLGLRRIDRALYARL